MYEQTRLVQEPTIKICVASLPPNYTGVLLPLISFFFYHSTALVTHFPGWSLISAIGSIFLLLLLLSSFKYCTISWDLRHPSTWRSWQENGPIWFEGHWRFFLGQYLSQHARSHARTHALETSQLKLSHSRRYETPIYSGTKLNGLFLVDLVALIACAKHFLGGIDLIHLSLQKTLYLYRHATTF